MEIHDEASLQNTLERSGLQNSLEGSGLKNSLERFGLQNSLERSGLQNTLESSRLQNTLERSGLQNSLEGPGLQNSLERSGLQISLERSGLQNTLERSGLQNTLERSGLQNTLERSGLQNTLERSGLQNTLERSGPQNSLERSGLQSTLQYVELGGVVGVFIRLDAAQIHEHMVETILKTAQNQIKVMVQAFKDGSVVQRDVYIRASDRNKKGKGCICKYCAESFYCRLDLVAHQSKHHPNLPIRAGRKSVIPCPNCGKLVHNLSLHFKMKHSDMVVYNGGLAYCKQCEQTYPMDSDHTSVCRFSPRCPECKKTFSQWRGMIKHRKVVHMGEKIECPTCKKTFHDTQSLKKHSEAVHMKLKRVCPLCGATITCLSTHMNAVHADVRNFACDMCEKKFKSKYDLTRHRDSVHLGHKAACPLCGKHISNLNQHIRVVHKQIKFPCTLCTKKYNTKSELEKHIKQMHSPGTNTGVTGGTNTGVNEANTGLGANTQFTQKNGSEPVEELLQPDSAKNEVGGRAQYIISSSSLVDEPAGLPVQPPEPVQPAQPESVPEDQLINHYLEKHSFSLTPSAGHMKEESMQESLVISKQDQIISKQGIEFLPINSRSEARFIELRPIEGEHSHQDQIDRLHHPGSDDRLHHDGTTSQDDRMHHSGLDERSYYTIDERMHHRFHEGDERLRHYDHDPPGDNRVDQHLDSSVDDRLHQYHDHQMVRDGGRQNPQNIEDDHHQDEQEHLHQHGVLSNVGQSREVDLSLYSLRGASSSTGYHLAIRSAAQAGREYDQPEHQQESHHYNPH